MGTWGPLSSWARIWIYELAPKAYFCSTGPDYSPSGISNHGKTFLLEYSTAFGKVDHQVYTESQTLAHSRQWLEFSY